MNSVFTPLTPVVKRLIILNISIWVLFVLIYQNFFSHHFSVFSVFGFVPYEAVTKFYFWQFFTYMFFHSSQIFHILFNMLILWWLGSELESFWGRKFFLTYYFVCGVGAAFIYGVSLFFYYFISGNLTPLFLPVVGASGAIFGLILAYGILFGERILYFMMLFPMKAKHFVMILGGIEVVTLLNTGVKGQVANLAHLGGLISGYLFLLIFRIWKKNKREKSRFGRRGFLTFLQSKRRFKLIKNDEEKRDPTRYWH